MVEKDALEKAFILPFNQSRYFGRLEFVAKSMTIPFKTIDALMSLNDVIREVR